MRVARILLFVALAFPAFAPTCYESGDACLATEGFPIDGCIRIEECPGCGWARSDIGGTACSASPTPSDSEVLRKGLLNNGQPLSIVPTEGDAYLRILIVLNLGIFCVNVLQVGVVLSIAIFNRIHGL